MVFQCRDDWNHTLEYVSRGCYELTGFHPEELMSSQAVSFSELIFPDDREMVWINLHNAFVHRKPFELVYRILTRDKGLKWVRALGVNFLAGGKNQQVLEGFISDITSWKIAEEQLQRQMRRFQALRTIDIAISAGPDLRFMLDVLLEQVLSQLHVDAAAILLRQPAGSAMEYAASRGFHGDGFLHSKLRIGEGLAGWTAKSWKTIHIPDLSASGREVRELPSFDAEGFVGYYGVPLVVKGQVKGVLEVFMRSSQDLDQDRLDFLEALAGQAAIAIDNSTLSEQLQDSNTELTIAYDATLEGWAKALEMRDRETVGHTHRVIEMTMRMANKLGIHGEALLHIRRGALLHDIGKMGIPDSILLKPGPLTPAEWEIMRQHPLHAYEMLKEIDYLTPALEIPYCHHERWDGNGYPQGLNGSQIPLSARIFTVADVWDALTSDRRYRNAWPEQQAMEYIEMESGRHFDPQVVKLFLDL